MTTIPSEKNTNPLVSVFLLTYNQEQYVREAIKGALSQTYSPLEIIVSDDASTDSTWRLIEAELSLYTGNHKIVARRNIKNLGINRHFNEVMKQTNGDFIVAMAGDDVSLPNRVSESIRIIQNHGVSGVFSNAITIDENGTETGMFHKSDMMIKSLTPESILSMGGNGGSGFSLSWRRKDLEVFDSIPEEPLGEDAFIPFRCALINGLVYYNKPLVKYRQHGQNVSFWNQREKAKDKKTRNIIARKSVKHFLSMYLSWKNDLAKINKSKMVSAQNRQKINELIEDWVWIHHERSQMLDNGSLGALFKVLKNLRNYKNTKINRVALREIAWYLFHIYPKLYFTITMVYSKIRLPRLR